MKRCAAAVLLVFGFLPLGRTDSAFKTAPASNGPVGASAHLDFRIAILPSLALSMQSTGFRVQGNGAALTLQSNPSLAWDGRSPTRSVQLRPQHQVIDASIPASQFSNGALITIAAP